MINTTTNMIMLDGIIEQKFDPELLYTYLQRSRKRYDNISKTVPKKIRPQDVGKAFDYLKLMKLYEECYERKAVEEADYEAETKKLIEEMPRIPITGGVMRFRRMEPPKRFDEQAWEGNIRIE